jgi:pyruvate dehydrogenase E2 component (dihydrolipoamide acetyltransferase)
VAQTIEVTLPDIGDFKDVEVIEILVGPGDHVESEDPLITLESDKASMEIPAPQAGTVSEVKVSMGDRINQGDLIVLLSSEETAPEPAAEWVEDAPGSVSEPDPQPDAEAASPDAGSADSTPVTENASEIIDVPLPDIGDFNDVEIIEILVQPGDSVAAEQSLLTLESDKATMEIPSPVAGTVDSVVVAIGDRINRGDVIAKIASVASQPAAAAAPAPVAQAPAPVAAATDLPDTPRLPGEKPPARRPVIARPSDAPPGKAHASPGVRRFARELGVDLYYVPGSGPKGRVTKQDVQAYVKRSLAEGASAAPTSGSGGGLQLPTLPEIDFSKFGEIEEQELGRIKKLSGAHLHRAWLNVPHVTQFDEADITELEAFRKGQKDEAAKAGVKLTFMPFLIKALCKALAAYPQFNSSLSADGERLILKKYIHVGVAVDTPNGLVVPVIRDVDSKGVFELAGELGEVSARAREGKLAPADLQGGCISISSLGGIGGTQFSPIVNAPEVAILGISKAEMTPKWNGTEFLPRLMMPFSLSYDHRVIDGAEGVRFTSYLAQLLSDIRRLLL